MSARDSRIPEGFKCAMKGEAVPLPVDPSTLRFPLLGSTKIDGVRATAFGGAFFSYSLKPFRNRHLPGLPSNLDNVDGELTVGAPNAPDVCKRTTGALNSFDGDLLELSWNVFDYWDASGAEYAARAKVLRESVLKAKDHGVALKIRIVKQKLLRSMEELEAYEASVLDDGWEGVMLRDPHGLYKMGRSTIRDGALVKLKRFSDMEARVVGSYELQHNGNAAEVSASGHTKRSSAKAGKTGLGVLGGFVMVGIDGPFKGVEFRVGGGFSDAERRDYWERRDSLINKIGTVKFLGHGADRRPRHPTWKLFRMPEDR